MASTSIVQLQQEQQQQAEQATATPSTSSGAAASEGGEKNSAQEVLVARLHASLGVHKFMMISSPSWAHGAILTLT